MLNSFRIPWAADRWFSEDKLTHAVWAYAGTLTLLFLLPWFMTVLLVAMAGVLVEVVQWVRWDIWHNDNVRYSKNVASRPPPAFSDQPSYRDLAWDGGGILLGLVARLLISVLVQ